MTRKPQPRDKDIHVKLTQDDIRAMSRMARVAGLPLATWARMILLKEMARAS